MSALVDRTVRPMTEDDLDDVARLEAATRRRPWSRELLAAELARHDRLLVVATSPRQAGSMTDAVEPPPVVGYAAALLTGDEAHVLNVLVASLRRRDGIGTALVASLLSRIESVGIRRVTLEVRASNAAAVALYGRLGFVNAGTRPGYYPDGRASGGREDAMIMWREGG